jgi:hypothetical protein
MIFGEDENDTRSLETLMIGLCPRLKGRTRRSRSLVLMKGASPRDLPTMADKLARIVAAAQAKWDVTCVFTHEDADALEPNDAAIAERLETALERAGVPAHAVVPAWELEAWWFLWPDAVADVHESWRKPTDMLGRQVGRIVDAKDKLEAAVTPRNLGRRERDKFRKYKESDSPRIAEKVVLRNLAATPGGASASYERFRSQVSACCEKFG